MSFVESTLLPQGFDVRTNERVFNDEGVQVAEFDIEIRGKVGSTAIAWLIECRDRPGEGPAPGSWIEQLLGRRERFGFNKVTAVSTTGFSAPAVEFARERGIELREVNALSAEEFADWLMVRHLRHVERVTRLDHATVIVSEEEGEDRRNAVRQSLSGKGGDAKFLRSSKTGELMSPIAAFSAAVSAGTSLHDDLVPDQAGKLVRLCAQYPDDDYFIVDTSLGPIRVREIVFYGELSVRETLVPLDVIAEYRHVETGGRISQVASFAPRSIYGAMFSLEMHRIAESGETHVILRKLPNDA